MAVYTKYNQDEIDEILSNYDLGKLETFNDRFPRKCLKTLIFDT